MKRHPLFTLALVAALVYLGIVSVRQLRTRSANAKAASAQKSLAPVAAAASQAATNSSTTNSAPAGLTNAASGLATNANLSGLTNAGPAGATNALAAGNTVLPPGGVGGQGPGLQVAGKVASGTNAPPNKEAAADADKINSSDEIPPLSFQGANVDMIVQWLAKTTGKSVFKNSKVQCQLTIVSSRKVTQREALNLVYRALSLEGFNTIETSKAIFIVPEGQDPKMSPEVLDGSKGEIPEGRQRLVKVFPLRFISPADLRDKVRPVLSEKATIDLDDRASQIIVTDYNENLRLLSELIKELDITAASDSIVQIYPLKHSEAEDLSSLLSLILNAQPGTPSSSGGSARPSGGGPARMPSGPGMPEGMMPGGPPPSSGGGGGGGPSSSSSGGAQTGQQVKIWADKTANRLIVSAPKSRLPEVEKLIGILDVDKPEDVGVRVIPLKNVSAEDLVKEIGPLYQKASGRSLKETIEVTASSRANSVIVLSNEANFKALSKLIASLDTEEAQEKVMRAFSLKNADAEDVAKQLKDLSQDQDSNSRYPYYYFSGSSQNTKASKKPSVVADRRRNTVIVQAPPSSMESIAKMIETLDEPVAENALAPKIFRLKYVSASDIEDVLNELFLKKTQQRSYYFYYDDYPQETADKNVGRLYGKVRITSEPYSNSIIVTANSKESLDAVEEVIKELDAPSEAGESTLRVGLKFAKATVLANSINILFAKNGSPTLRQTAQPGQPNATPQQPSQPGTTSQTGFDLEKESKEEGYYPWLGGPPDNTRSSDGRTSATRPVSDLVGRVRAVADQRSNALLISANVHFFPQVLKLVADLDAPTEQVLIEARLVEISTDYLDKLGVRWSPDGSQVFTPDDYDNSLLAHANSQYQQGFGGRTTVNTPGSAASASGAIPLAQTLASLRSGVLGSSISMDYLVQFLRKTTDAKVLAEPQINIRDNETGRLFVGQQVPIPQNNVVSQLGGQTTSFTYKDVGVVLEVTPHINTSGDVELSIHAESSTVVAGQTVLGGSVFDTRNFRTDLTAKNGQTLVLGGIIQKQVSEILRKTPLLGDIPGLGWAFKKRDKSSREVELMVFMRPKVTRTPEQAQELLEDIYKKAPGMKQWNEDNQHSNDKAKKK